MNSEFATIFMEHRLTDAGFEYRFSDRLDEVFPTKDELLAHRGLTPEQLRQTIKITTPDTKHES